MGTKNAPFLILLLTVLLVPVPSWAETPEPTSGLTYVETVKERREALRNDLETLNARWRAATDPRVRLGIARAITLAKLDFEIGILELQRQEVVPDLSRTDGRSDTSALDAALAALRTQRAEIVGDETGENPMPADEEGTR